MTTSAELAVLVSRLKSGEDPEIVKRDAKEFLRKVDPAELIDIEKTLVDAGMKTQDLRRLCSIHTQLGGDGAAFHLKASLPADHVIHTLMEEHDRILAFLETLEAIRERISGASSWEDIAPDLPEFHNTVAHLNGAEKHHKREEDVLFAELLARGLGGPPTIMRMEHDEMRVLKHELLKLSEAGLCPGKMSFEEFRKNAKSLASRLVSILREHIYKENNILYPMSLKLIQEEDVWQDMRKACDAIGYCCFTPLRK